MPIVGERFERHGDVIDWLPGSLTVTWEDVAVKAWQPVAMVNPVIVMDPELGFLIVTVELMGPPATATTRR